MDLDSNKIFIYQNVLFHENLFPLKKDSTLQVPELITPNSDPSVIYTHSPSSPPHSIPISPSEISKTRVKKVPLHLQDYHCYALAPDNNHHLSSSLSHSKLSLSHSAYINSITKIPIPTSYDEAQKDKEWCDDVDLEFNAMEPIITWEVTSLPKGKKAAGYRLLYSLKFDANGTLDIKKVHLVAKGYTHKEGLDFKETFSLVAKMVTIKLLLKIHASKRCVLHQLDISNTFLNWELDEDICMKFPE